MGKTTGMLKEMCLSRDEISTVVNSVTPSEYKFGVP